MADRDLSDYVEVAERIQAFRDKHPEGSLQPVTLAEPFRIVQAQGTDKGGELMQQTFIVYVAAAYRTPDDPRPGIGAAWEIWPGRTPYTRGSELMNAETSAWGRAIVAALAADTKRGVATREEVEFARARQEHRTGRTASADRGKIDRGPLPPADDPWAGQPAGSLPHEPEPEMRPGTIDGRQRTVIMQRLGKMARQERLSIVSGLAGRPVESVNDLSWAEAAAVTKQLEGQ